MGGSQRRAGADLDMIVAAVARANACVAATDNERDFARIAFINPMRRTA